MNITQLSKNFNYSLLSLGISGLQKMYNLKPQFFSYGEARTLFNNLGMKAIPVSQMDTQYAYLDVETAEPLVWDVMTFLNKIAYRAETFDCDNFSFLTSSLFSLFFNINTCGTIWGDIYDAQTGKFIAGHYFNGITTYNPLYKKFKLYVADSLNPGFTEVERDKPIIINSWEYRIKKGNFY